MLTKKSIRVPIYDFKVEVCIFDDIEEAKREYPRYISYDMLGCTIEWGGSICTLIVPSDNYSTLIHELEHVKNLVWKAKGYKPQADNDEPDAYLLEWLFNRVDKIIKKHLATRC